MITLTAEPRQLEGIVGTRRYGHVLEAKLIAGPRRRYRVDSERTLKIATNSSWATPSARSAPCSTTAATPSIPHAFYAVEVIGLEGLPQAGDQLSVVADRNKAKNISAIVRRRNAKRCWRRRPA